MFKNKYITEQEFKNYFKTGILSVLLKKDMTLSTEELKKYFFDLINLAKTYGYVLPFIKISDEEIMDMVKEVSYSI